MGRIILQIIQSLSASLKVILNVASVLLLGMILKQNQKKASLSLPPLVILRSSFHHHKLKYQLRIMTVLRDQSSMIVEVPVHQLVINQLLQYVRYNVLKVSVMMNEHENGTLKKQPFLQTVLKHSS